MKFLLFLILFCWTPQPSLNIDPKSINWSYNFPTDLKKREQVAYIHKYAHYVLSRDNPVFPQIILAQGILESKSGKSELAKKANNHFGIKSWEKIGFYKVGKIKYQFFKNPLKSFEAHRELLLKERYKKCRDAQSIEDCAKCLQKSGYAEDPAYAKKILKLIDDLNLRSLKLLRTKTDSSKESV